MTSTAKAAPAFCRRPVTRRRPEGAALGSRPALCAAARVEPPPPWSPLIGKQGGKLSPFFALKIEAAPEIVALGFQLADQTAQTFNFSPVNLVGPVGIIRANWLIGGEQGGRIDQPLP
jgi:hypothetical protein